MRHLVCTVIAPNYLDQFLMLGESVAKEMPEADLRVLVLQDCSDVAQIQTAIADYLARLGSTADHRAITIDECAWREFDVEAAAIFYGILEFATSVKPALLRNFLDEGWARVTYLDPDVQVFTDFTPLLDDITDVSLTPHFLSDIPRDGHRPTTNDVLMAGFYNLGFCSVRPSARPFLDWWAERLQFECLNDHLRGYFTDQKIIDMSSVMAHVQLIRDPGLNVAYWNLHERKIVGAADEWSVRVGDVESPLYFFHFSGFRRDHGVRLSVHSSRHVVGTSVPREFVRQYERRLHDDEEDTEYPYVFSVGGATLGESLPPDWRRCFHEDAEVHARAGWSLRRIRNEIYAPRDPAKWARCAQCGIEHENFGTRVRGLLDGWTSHPSFAGVPNGIAAFFRAGNFEFRARPREQLAWAADHLVNTLQGLDELSVEILTSAGDAMRHAADLVVVGYLTYRAGTGQIARAALRTLEAADIHPAIDRVYAPDDDVRHLSALLRRANPLASMKASVLCVVNADQWRYHVRDARRINPATQHVEAVWAWELEEIPSQMFDVAASGDVRRVHALSRWSARAMAKALPVPVQRFAPYNIDVSSGPTGDTGTRHGARVPSRYVLTTLDAKSSVARKNPEGVLKLWRRVHADHPDHWLVVKSADLRDLASSTLIDLLDETPRTLLIDEHLGDGEYAALLAGCDVFVSLHRSEGMGLTPIEAGMQGRPVVYTNYGGVTDYLEERFFPVSYSLVGVGQSDEGEKTYDAFARWAEPNLDDAERQLRRALALIDTDEAVTELLVDQKQLAENLQTAQQEVVATARRLIEEASSELIDVEDELFARLDRARSEAESPTVAASPNRVLFAVVAVTWWIYKRFPRAFRRQFNIALNKLREEGSGP